jgi:hypothetical protein
LRSARTSDIACAASASLCRSTSPPPDRDRLLACRDRRLEIVELEAVRRELVEQGGAVRRGEAIAVRKGGAAVRRRLAPRTAQRRFVRGARRPAQDRSGVARLLRVVGTRRERRLAVGPRLERGEHAPVQRGGARRRQRLLDRSACELVAKAQALAVGDEQPARETRFDRRRRRREHVGDEREIDLARDDRDELQQLARERRQGRRAGEDRVAHRHRNAGRRACRGGAPR